MLNRLFSNNLSVYWALDTFRHGGGCSPLDTLRPSPGPSPPSVQAKNLGRRGRSLETDISVGCMSPPNTNGSNARVQRNAKQAEDAGKKPEGKGTWTDTTVKQGWGEWK